MSVWGWLAEPTFPRWHGLAVAIRLVLGKPELPVGRWWDRWRERGR